MMHQLKKFYESAWQLSPQVIDFCFETEQELSAVFQEIDMTAQFNQMKVLKAMQTCRLSETHFTSSTGYGYHDAGRDVLEEIYAELFQTESALVRPQLISGTHAITTALFGNLRCGDELLSPAGPPYDTLQGVIGTRKTRGSLLEHGITYREVSLKEDGKIDYPGIEKGITAKTKLALIQRSKGYSWRHSFTVEEIKELILFIKAINSKIICMVDNCYGEFVEMEEPSQIGADLLAGSLIKNPGGGLAPSGGYIAGREEYVENAAVRLTAPGIGKEAGPGLGVVSPMIQGLFQAPQVVSGALKGAVFASRAYEKLGFQVLPRWNEKRSDIVQAIRFHDEAQLLAFCEQIQKAAPVDSYVRPVPWDMPGYDCPVVMAAGAFIQGSSIELSADAPIKAPYTVYFQGGLTWHHARLGIMMAVSRII